MFKLKSYKNYAFPISQNEIQQIQVAFYLFW